MKITIEKNIPIPSKIKEVKNELREQIAKMEVGDSFEICTNYSRSSTVKQAFKGLGFVSAMRSEGTDRRTARGLREFKLRFWRVE